MKNISYKLNPLTAKDELSRSGNLTCPKQGALKLRNPYSLVYILPSEQGALKLRNPYSLVYILPSDI